MQADNDNVSRNVICGEGNVDVLSDDPGISASEEYRLSQPLRMLAYNLGTIRADVQTESTVYVISDIFGRFVKIGEAHDVNKRLLQLQAGNPRRLYVHRAFWFRNKQYAQFVEREAHRNALVSGYKRMQSEWFACSPTQAHKLITSTIDALRISEFAVATPGKSHWDRAA